MNVRLVCKLYCPLCHLCPMAGWGLAVDQLPPPAAISVVKCAVPLFHVARWRASPAAVKVTTDSPAPLAASRCGTAPSRGPYW